MATPETAMTTCRVCGNPCAWTPFGPYCSWDCYDAPRVDPDDTAAQVAEAPEALAFYFGLGPGRHVGEVE